MKNNILSSLILIMILFNTSGCDDKNIKEVQIKIQTIQTNYNTKNFDEIYNQSSDEFKKVSDRDGFVKFLQEKFSLLGKFKSSKILFKNEKNEDIVNITYLSTYERYTLAEDYTFKDEKNGRGFRLLQYTVDTGGKIVPVTKTGSSVRIDISTN